MKAKLRQFVKHHLLMKVIFFLVVFLFATQPFFHDGFFQITDDVQVVRVEKMADELRGGQFPVRYVDSLGNTGGYMLFNFYSPFVYYLGAFIHLLGIPLVKTVKIVFLLGYIVGLTGIIVLLKRYVSWASVAIGAVLFISAPYVGYDVYFRGALAEFFGFMLLPWVFWAFLRLKITERSFEVRDVLLAGFLFALLVITHNITAYMASFFLGVSFILPPFRKQSILASSLALLTGVLLSAFYWVPHIVEQGNIIYDQTFLGGEVYKTSFSTPIHLAAFTQYGAGTRYPMLGMSLMIGGIVGCILGLWTFKKEKKQAVRSLYLLSSVGFLSTLFLMWGVSLVFWETVPFLTKVQFPWRFLTLSTLFSVVLTVLVTRTLSFWQTVLVGMLLFLPTLTWYYHYLRPTTYSYIAMYKPEDVCQTTTWDQELLPKWVQTCLPTEKPLPLVSAENSQTAVTGPYVTHNGRKITFTTTGQKSAVVIAKYYYPGWTVSVDQTPVRVVSSGKHGLLRFSVPEGVHTVEVSYTNTWWRTLSNVVSSLSILVLCVVLVRVRMRKKS